MIHQTTLRKFANHCSINYCRSETRHEFRLPKDPKVLTTLATVKSINCLSNGSSRIVVDRESRRFCARWLLTLLCGVIVGCDRRAEDGEAKQLPEQAVLNNGTVQVAPSSAERIGIQKVASKSTLFTQKTEVYGRVVPNPNATFDLMSPSAGQVFIDSGIWPMPGTRVIKGQQLATLKVRISPDLRADFESRIVEAKARLTNNEDVVQSLSRITQGLQNISAREILSRTELDTASANLSKAKSQVELDKAIIANWLSVMNRVNAAESVQGDFWHLPLLSPHEGTIAEIATAEGAFVEAGTLLLRIIDQSQQLIRLEVPPNAPSLLDGAVEVDTLVIKCQGKSFQASYLGRAPSIDFSSQNSLLLYSVRDASDQLRSGLLVTASVANGESKVDAISVPNSSVLQHRGLNYVYVAIDDSTYQRRSVDILGIQENETLVKPSVESIQDLAIGVVDGEIVVGSGAQLLLSREFLVVGGDSD